MAKVPFRAPSAVRVVFSGQSHLTQHAPRTVPFLTAQSAGISSWTSIAHGGDGWYELAARAGDELVPQARNIDGALDVLVMAGGQGDILDSAPSGQQDGATCFARAVSYAEEARAAGFGAVILATLPAMGPDMLGTGRPTVSEQQAFDDLNALILAGNEVFDAIADVHAVMGDATDADLFAIDRLHLTAEGGNPAMAGVLASTLTALLA